MHLAAPGVVGLSLSSRAERGYVIAALSGELDIAAAPTPREKLLGLLGPGASRLIIDLSAVSYADARGLAVLVGTGRRARLLGGFLRLAAPSPEVARVLSITGLSRHLEIFPTVHAAITSPLRSQRRHDGTAEVRTNIATPARRTLSPHVCTPGRPGAPSTAVNSASQSPPCSRAPARSATPTPPPVRPTLRALARAYAGTSQASLTQAAHSLQSVLTRQPSPTPRRSPPPRAVFAAGSTRSSARPT